MIKCDLYFEAASFDVYRFDQTRIQSCFYGLRRWSFVLSWLRLDAVYFHNALTESIQKPCEVFFTTLLGVCMMGSSVATDMYFYRFYFSSEIRSI